MDKKEIISYLKEYPRVEVRLLKILFLLLLGIVGLIGVGFYLNKLY